MDQDLPKKLDLVFGSGFFICHFKDKRFEEGAPAHFYVGVPVSPMDCIVVCIITSQGPKRRSHYCRKGNGAENSLIELFPGDFPFIKKDSVIDCNQAEPFNLEKLRARISPEVPFRVRHLDPDFEPNLKRRIVRAIQESPEVKAYIKRMLQ